MKLLLLLAALVALAVFAQEFPGKPIRMVVGFPLGGGTDVVARIITPRYGELLGQSVVIENRPRRTGTMAAGQVAKSAPDGYTIMMGHVSVNAIALHLAHVVLPHAASERRHLVWLRRADGACAEAGRPG